jgi:hypothetical protein
MAANWNSFSIQLPGQALLEPIRSILETILTFLEILKALLDIIKAFLIAIPNPIEAIVKALMALLTTLVNTINQTGLYAYFDIPDLSTDPNLFKFVGGYQSFTQRFKGSVLDTRDPNRPQPISGATESGFLMIVADAADISALMKLIRVLRLFFNRPHEQSRFAAPANVKILPVSQSKDPITSIAKVFSTPIGGVSLGWTLGGSVRPPDPGFQDLGGIIANEFRPPQWLIERSSTPINGSVDVGAGGVGHVTWMQPTQHEKRGTPGDFILQLTQLSDENGEPVIKFDHYMTLLTPDGTLLGDIENGLLGELGLIQYFDTDVQPDQTYYYRVRAFTGTLFTNGTSLAWDSTPMRDVKTQEYYLPWPGANLTMGKPSPVMRIRVPKVPANFDVLTTLVRLFEAAFSLNFHLPVASTDKFDSSGNPTGTTPVTHIGYGSLLRQSGALAAFQAIPAVASISQSLGTTNLGTLTTVSQTPVNSTTGNVEEQPWQQSNIEFQAGKLAGVVASSLLEQGSGAIQQFQLIMQGSFPRGNLAPKETNIASAKNLQELVYAITDPGDPTTGAVSTPTYNAYVAAFSDASCRQNILYAIQYVTSFTLGGTPPDWIKFSILRDLIPWSGQLLYDILAKIQALLDAFKSIFAEIIAFINLIERKITVLEEFIKYLISILDFILSLNAGFYLLFVPTTSGDIFQWFNLIDNAGGTKPTSGPGGYSAGVSMAYVAPNVAALAAAFSLIF